MTAKFGCILIIFIWLKIKVKTTMIWLKIKVKTTTAWLKIRVKKVLSDKKNGKFGNNLCPFGPLIPQLRLLPATPQIVLTIDQIHLFSFLKGVLPLSFSMNSIFSSYK
jgi:hypothetical protein